MHGLNRIFILGYLGNEPKMLSSKGGHPYAALSIATYRPSQQQEGTTQTTDWHYVHVWGKQAEICSKFLTKGQPVLVEGYLSHYQRKLENGETERKTSINAIKVDFLPRASQAEEVATNP